MADAVVTPRPAATLLLLRDGREGIETLMVVRHEKLAFGSGALVFPGGRVDRADEAIAAGLAREGDDEAGLAFQVAAIRETLEETGVLLARSARDADMVSLEEARACVARHRAALNAGALGFGEMLATEGLVPATGGLVRYAHWITPPSRPKRFDTHFFLAAAPPGQEAVHDGTESTESVWLTPEMAFGGSASGRYKLLLATRMNLMKLAMSGTVEAALAAAKASTIVPVTPETVSDRDGIRTVRIPEEAGYGGEIFESTDPPAI